MKKHFYFFRHGQTNENQTRIRKGLGDEAYLTDMGKQQAHCLADFLADKSLDVIYSSPYERAVDTSKVVARQHKNIEIIIDDALREAVFGFWDPENSEDREEMNKTFTKIKCFLEKISSQDEYKNVAVCSHGGVTRALCWAAGTKIEGIKNCQCFHFVLRNNIWKYIENFEPNIS